MRSAQKTPMALFYEGQLVLLILICVGLWVVRRYHLRPSPSAITADGQASRLSRRYLLVYALVMGADWLQGPYIYSVYREQHGLPERLVAALFVLGFLTAGVSAPAVGVWADQYGRKRMCMVFCVSYALACALIQISSLPLLFWGRFLGGFSTAILFSCFESWLISSANSLSLSSHDLSVILGNATLLNSIAATVAGIASNELVEYSAMFSSPFLASGGLLLLALPVIGVLWEENYGGTEASVGSLFSTRHLLQAGAAVNADKRLLILEAASPDHALPLGYIFSSFMLSMTLGALLYNTAVDVYGQHREGADPGDERDRTIVFHARLNAIVCASGALAFMISVASGDEHIRFWAFCAFEACVGVYYPVQGMLRGKLVPDEHRATLSSLFRVPLNIFVTVSLLTGVAAARHLVLLACSILLLASALVTATAFSSRPSRPALASLRRQ
ncbi:DUF791-domain-containing protein [Trametes polyzona]|nr:DUF791-domain-containing protein [Trametes polyzona]